MEMLRKWNGSSLKPLVKKIEQFGVSPDKLRLLKFEVLTPDSFIWLLASNDSRLCIYAEDFVPSLEHVQKAMEKYGVLNDEDDKYKLVEVTNSTRWDESSPVISSDIYSLPADREEFMKYALPSGYDFVFLGKSLKQ